MTLGRDVTRSLVPSLYVARNNFFLIAFLVRRAGRTRAIFFGRSERLQNSGTEQFVFYVRLPVGHRPFT